MNNKNCPICYKQVFSELKLGCKMCGMPLEDKSRDFCSKECRSKYTNIHKHQ